VEEAGVPGENHWPSARNWLYKVGWTSTLTNNSNHRIPVVEKLIWFDLMIKHFVQTNIFQKRNSWTVKPAETESWIKWNPVYLPSSQQYLSQFLFGSWRNNLNQVVHTV
jgi:hypothetical protein